jgi:hypothetical protein
MPVPNEQRGRFSVQVNNLPQIIADGAARAEVMPGPTSC